MEVIVILVMDLVARDVTSEVAVFDVVGGELVMIKEKVVAIILQLLGRLGVIIGRDDFFTHSLAGGFLEGLKMGGLRSNVVS